MQTKNLHQTAKVKTRKNKQNMASTKLKKVQGAMPHGNSFVLKPENLRRPFAHHN